MRDKNIIEISEGHYPEDRSSAMFSCPTGTKLENVGKAINKEIADNKGKFRLNPSQAKDRTQADDVLEEFGCKRIRKDNHIHLANKRRTRTKTEYNTETGEVESEEVREPKLLLNGDVFTEVE